MVSRSSTEAEFRALADTTCEVTWIQCLLKEFQVTVPTPVSMLCGNASSIALASNPVHHARSKHIEIDCHFVRDKVKAGQILTQYVFNKNQLADILTKCLSRPPSIYLCICPKSGHSNPYTLPTCEGDDETIITPGSKHPDSVIKRDAKHSVQSIQRMSSHKMLEESCIVLKWDLLVDRLSIGLRSKYLTTLVDVNDRLSIECFIVVKETLRLHLPAPLLVPHESLSHTHISGYDVFPGTTVLINGWRYRRDPSTWVRMSGSEFYPERRSCPAMNTAPAIVESVIANLLMFDWEAPDIIKNEELNMEEEGSLIVRRKLPLCLVPTKHKWEN
ncbi:parthenolide synthase [Tanacetum coccineum]|uniref:Parthenolide synthase n=1 Tax=Tanacetum coccineum TaxID=301880 RepID=A0ABQ5J543_9ASTR